MSGEKLPPSNPSNNNVFPAPVAPQTTLNSPAGNSSVTSLRMKVCCVLGVAVTEEEADMGALTAGVAAGYSQVMVASSNPILGVEKPVSDSVGADNSTSASLRYFSMRRTL